MVEASSAEVLTPKVLTKDAWKALPPTRRRRNPSAPRREYFDPDLARWRPALIVGFKFPCPECGAVDRWTANYVVPAHQGIELRVDDDGGIDAVDYDGDEETFDADDNESYSCGCGYTMAPDGTKYVAPQLSDRAALDKIQRLMSGRTWDGAADLLEAIAEIVKGSGRPIAPAGQNSPRWDADA